MSQRLEVEELLLKGSLGLLSEQDVRATTSSVVMRVPAMAKFLASVPEPMRRHELLDLAFCSYAWHEPGAHMTSLDIPWSFCLRNHDVAGRLAEFALSRFVNGEGYDASLEERQGALMMRRSAGDWAYAISAADFVRFVAACRLGAEALYLVGMFCPEDDSAKNAIAQSLWQRVGLCWKVCQDGHRWMENQTALLLQDAEATLGSLAKEPSEDRLSQLLRMSKLADSRAEPENRDRLLCAS